MCCFIGAYGQKLCIYGAHSNWVYLLKTFRVGKVSRSVCHCIFVGFCIGSCCVQNKDLNIVRMEMMNALFALLLLF